MQTSSRCWSRFQSAWSRSGLDSGRRMRRAPGTQLEAGDGVAVGEGADIGAVRSGRVAAESGPGAEAVSSAATGCVAAVESKLASACESSASYRASRSSTSSGFHRGTMGAVSSGSIQACHGEGRVQRQVSPPTCHPSSGVSLARTPVDRATIAKASTGRQRASEGGRPLIAGGFGSACPDAVGPGRCH